MLPNILMVQQKIGRKTKMKITFLGTGAATSFPLAFCTCPTCSYARLHGGKNIRKRSSILINADLLIDLGPDTVASSLMYGLDLSQIKYWLQTHAHSDHFDAGHFMTRSSDYAAQGVQPLTLYASSTCITCMSQMLSMEEPNMDLMGASLQSRFHLTVIPAQIGQAQTLGTYHIWAIPTAHDPDSGSVVYAISDGQSAILYATDCAFFDDTAWAILTKCGYCFSLVILEQTVGGNLTSCPNHLNAQQVRDIIHQLHLRKLTKKTCVCYVTHLSHEGNLPHAQLSKEAAPYGYHIAYDGLTLFS